VPFVRDEVSVAVAVEAGFPAALEVGVCDGLRLGVPDRFEVEVREGR